MPTVHGDALRPGSPHATAPQVLIPLLLLGACSAPAPRPLQPDELVRTLEQRSATPPEIAHALELAGLAPQAGAPAEATELRDPAQPGFWYACAEAWSPAVRAARRNFEAAVQGARSAGRPGALRAGAEVADLSDPAAESKLVLTFDLVGLFGLEPAAAARALADARARAALGELEAARWRVRFEVDRARVRLAEARAARRDLEQLIGEAEQEARRLEILERHGRLAAAPLAASRLALRELSRALEQQRTAESTAREALARACGLPPGSPVLDLDHPLLLAAGVIRDPAPESAALFERLPELRVALFDYAVAEAQLRSEAAARWPDLDLGPRLAWSQPHLLLGALATAGLPWPGSLDGRIAAASTQREAARERAEDALLAVLTRAAGARERLASADALLRSAAEPAQHESEQLWSAARARLSVDPMALDGWADALRMRADTLTGFASARAQRSLAQLELEQVCGPEPGSALLASVREVQP